jgi:hypothetical protein
MGAIIRGTVTVLGLILKFLRYSKGGQSIPIFFFFLPRTKQGGPYKGSLRRGVWPDQKSFRSTRPSRAQATRHRSESTDSTGSGGVLRLRAEALSL